MKFSCKTKTFSFILCWFSSLTSGETWHQFGSFEYLFGTDPVNEYNQGNSRCTSKVPAATLVVIGNQEIQDFLEETIESIAGSSFGYYIGLVRIHGNFTWIDDGYTPFEYSYWNLTQTGNNEMECVTIGNATEFHQGQTNNLKWVNVECDTIARYICQREANITSTTEVAKVIPGNTSYTNAASKVTTTGVLTKIVHDENTPTLRTDQNQTDYLIEVVAPVAIVLGCFVVAFLFYIVKKCKKQSKKRRKASSFTEQATNQNSEQNEDEIEKTSNSKEAVLRTNEIYEFQQIKEPQNTDKNKQNSNPERPLRYTNAIYESGVVPCNKDVTYDADKRSCENKK